MNDRDTFAAAALTGWLASQQTVLSARAMASHAYEYADAMLAARGTTDHDAAPAARARTDAAALEPDGETTTPILWLVRFCGSGINTQLVWASQAEAEAYARCAMSPVDIIPLSDARVAAPPASSVTLTDAERRELEAAASGYENGAEKIVYRSPPRRRRAVALRGPLARAGGQTSGQDPLGQSQSAPENTPACDAQEPANRAVTLTDAEREVLITVRDIYSSAGDDSCDHIAATIDGLLTRAAKEGER